MIKNNKEIPEDFPQDELCEIEGCNNNIVCIINCKGYCRDHYYIIKNKKVPVERGIRPKVKPIKKRKKMSPEERVKRTIEARRRYQEKNREKIRERNRQYYRDNIEKERERHRIKYMSKKEK